MDMVAMMVRVDQVAIGPIRDPEDLVDERLNQPGRGRGSTTRAQSGPTISPALLRNQMPLDSMWA